MLYDISGSVVESTFRISKEIGLHSKENNQDRNNNSDYQIVLPNKQQIPICITIVFVMLMMHVGQPNYRYMLVEHGGVDRSTGYANAKVFLFLLMVVIYMEVGLPFIDKGNTT